MSESVHRKMQKVSLALGERIFLIWTPPDRDWFACCGGEEGQGSTPNAAVSDLVLKLEESLRQKVRESDQAHKTAEMQLTDLIG